MRVRGEKAAARARARPAARTRNALAPQFRVQTQDTAMPAAFHRLPAVDASKAGARFLAFYETRARRDETLPPTACSLARIF